MVNGEIQTGEAMIFSPPPPPPPCCFKRTSHSPLCSKVESPTAQKMPFLWIQNSGQGDCTPFTLPPTGASYYRPPCPLPSCGEGGDTVKVTQA